ncbi:MAG: RHS repeat protein [Myxococcales bacterium]|nr:RHS repeat protein [Myxococcales bacterium]
MAKHYDFLGRPLRNTSPDAGVRFMLDDALGRPFWRKDARGTVTTFAYDTAGRPT